MKLIFHNKYFIKFLLLFFIPIVIIIMFITYLLFKFYYSVFIIIIFSFIFIIYYSYTSFEIIEINNNGLILRKALCTKEIIWKDISSLEYDEKKDILYIKLIDSNVLKYKFKMSSGKNNIFIFYCLNQKKFMNISSKEKDYFITRVKSVTPIWKKNRIIKRNKTLFIAFVILLLIGILLSIIIGSVTIIYLSMIFNVGLLIILLIYYMIILLRKGYPLEPDYYDISKYGIYFKILRHKMNNVIFWNEIKNIEFNNLLNIIRIFPKETYYHGLSLMNYYEPPPKHYDISMKNIDYNKVKKIWHINRK